MHIGIITPRYPPNGGGGGAVSAQLLARLLNSHGAVNHVTVYTFDGDASNKQEDITIHRYDSPSIFLFEILNTYAYFKLKSQLSQDNVDIMHSYNMRLHPIVGHLSAKLKIPSVATLNSYAFIPYRNIDISVDNPLEKYKTLSEISTGRILRNRMRQIDSFIAISSTIAEIYREEMFPDQETIVIPNMCEPELSTRAGQMSSNGRLSNKQTSILYVGSLRETKGVEYLIKAAQYLSEDFYLTIAGGGKNESDLRKLAENIGVTNQISLLGRVPHDTVHELYAEADLFVHPGIWPEPFGRTILEAMQFGLPVVATDIGGPSEVIPQEDCLCEPANPMALAETIQMVSSSGVDIGTYNREYVNKKYSPEKVLPQLIGVYNSAVKK